MNSAFDGVQMPTVQTSLVELEHAQEVSLNSLLKEMGEVELDFLRSCLVIDGTQRASVADLLEHPYFGPEFKLEFEAQFAAWVLEDSQHLEAVKAQELRTADDKSEMQPGEIYTDTDEEEEEEEETSSSRSA